MVRCPLSAQGSASAMNSELRYEPDGRPSTWLVLGQGAQIAVLTIGITVLLAAVAFRGGGAERFLLWGVFATVLCSGIGTIFQALRFGRIGAGYCMLVGTNAIFVPICATGARERRPGAARHPRVSGSALADGALYAAIARAADADANGDGHRHHVGPCVRHARAGRAAQPNAPQGHMRRRHRSVPSSRWHSSSASALEATRFYGCGRR